MASLGPNSQRRYYQQNSPSSTHLLAPSPGPSTAPTTPPQFIPNGPGPHNVQAALSQTPRAVRNMASNSSLVCHPPFPSQPPNPVTYLLPGRITLRLQDRVHPSFNIRQSNLTSLLTIFTFTHLPPPPPPSFHSPPIRPYGVHTYSVTSPNKTTSFTTPIPGETVDTTTGAAY